MYQAFSDPFVLKNLLYQCYIISILTCYVQPDVSMYRKVLNFNLLVESKTWTVFYQILRFLGQQDIVQIAERCFDICKSISVNFD